MSHFRLSLDQDATTCAWLRDISVGHCRVLRLSLSHYSRDDAKVEDKGVTTWVHFKLFKQLEPRCYTLDDHEHAVRKVQQVCFRPIEVERILQSMEDIRLHLLTSMYIKQENITTDLSENFNISDSDDATRCHWYADIHESQRRKTRISYIMYNTKDPVKTTYVQFKLFTRSKEEEVFTKKSQVNYTIAEFRELSNQAGELTLALREAVYGQ